MTAYIIDTETTDTQERGGEVIELARMFVPFDLQIGSSWEADRFRPTKPMAWGALATHHILPSEIPDDCLPSSAAALPAGTQYVIGHNVDFDWAVLGSPSVKRICTLAMARAVWPELDSHKLGALVYFLMGANTTTKARLRDAHSAGADVEFCADIVRAILLKHPEITDIERLWRFSEDCRIPKIMTFGKYKDQPVDAVDRGWIGWYRRQSDIDPYLLEAFRRLGR